MRPASLVLIHGAGSGPGVFEGWNETFPGIAVAAVDLHESLDVTRASHADYADNVVRGKCKNLQEVREPSRQGEPFHLVLQTGAREEKSMSIWWLSVIIAGSGAVGGVGNALLSDNGFVRWKTEEIAGTSVWRPGVVGNVILGAIAAFLSWGLYGRYAGVEVVGGQAIDGPSFSETLGAIAGAMLIGVAGARFLTAEVDKRMLQEAAARAAAGPAAPEKAASIATATPASALRLLD